MNMTNTDGGNALGIMVVGPGRDTQGGITEVIARVLEILEADERTTIYWVVTHKSAGRIRKTWVALRAMFTGLLLMPKVDIVHIHSAAYVSFLRKSVFFWLAKLWRRPVIWHLHAPNTDFCEFFGASNLIGSYARAICRRVDRVVVLSKSWTSIVEPYFNIERVRVIPNPIPKIDEQMAIDHDRDFLRILYLAHLIQRKGYPVLIRAFAKVIDTYPETKLVFAGSGEVEEAKAMCNCLGVRENVEFLGWIGDAERTKELRKAGIFVLPSYQEGLPMGVLEAMAYGMAVVTTPVGGIGDVVIDGRNGVLVTPGESDELADALIELIGNSKECQRLGHQASEDVNAFAPAMISEHWIELYLELQIETAGHRHDCGN